MTITKRYYPEHAPGDFASFAMSFEDVFPCDVSIAGSLGIYTNVADPQLSSDFSVGPVGVQGRIIHANLSGGVSGTDYQLRWSASGSDGSIITRTALLLCAQTS